LKDFPDTFDSKRNGFAFPAAIGKMDHSDAIAESFGSR
jgi:hypothetical protein